MTVKKKKKVQKSKIKKKNVKRHPKRRAEGANGRREIYKGNLPAKCLFRKGGGGGASENAVYEKNVCEQGYSLSRLYLHTRPGSHRLCHAPSPSGDRRACISQRERTFDKSQLPPEGLLWPQTHTTLCSQDVFQAYYYNC